jgi:type I restriction enzyme M protein
VKVITTTEAAKNDFNLSPSRYVLQGQAAENRSIRAVLAELRQLEKTETDLAQELTPLLAKLAAMETQSKS